MTLTQAPLTKPVLQLLKNQLASLIHSAMSANRVDTLTEQYLMSRLGLKLSTDSELSPDLQRFQQHFVLYHLLYRLQTEWLATGEGFLSIGLAKVSLLDTGSANTAILAADTDNRSRREYYTDWQNFYAMSEQLLDDYLQQFWQFYSKGERDEPQLSPAQAEELLQLTHGFNLAQLKKAYRSQALLYHPDRHTDRTKGNAAKFIRIRQAYQLLLRQF
ncbi:DnaJ domain-containing protein [Arsukibacterium tuosuense]|uniref:DnaJ domain-containing protein n=1 Tax=Arsukibacterium tuosuense TaxID=1323745 RepID=A0A285IHF5_9GAMM|nr:DNA-J related domain-containing protein [Arsukibacterium tuosuense]SNY46506.1 DnaJ domain-containing protein [Arsukibacterium tuosuense]